MAMERISCGWSISISPSVLLWIHWWRKAKLAIFICSATTAAPCCWAGLDVGVTSSVDAAADAAAAAANDDDGDDDDGGRRRWIGGQKRPRRVANANTAASSSSMLARRRATRCQFVVVVLMIMLSSSSSSSSSQSSSASSWLMVAWLKIIVEYLQVSSSVRKLVSRIVLYWGDGQKTDRSQMGSSIWINIEISG